MLPVVAIFGAEDIEFRSEPDVAEFETNALECHCYADDHELERVLIEKRPHVIVTFGPGEAQFPRLMASPFAVRRRWLHFADTSDLDHVGRQAWLCYLNTCLDPRDDQPVVSVITPTYRTGDRFLRPLTSMKGQQYRNWQWVVYDDSDDDGLTAKMIEAHAAFDHRIQLIRPSRHSGRIGEVKANACALSSGQILLELDHDDELTPDALEMVVAAYRKYPEAGFYYSDCAEVGPDLQPLKYGEGWGFGLGSYYTTSYRGHDLEVATTGGISPKSIRHIVAAPNHFRAWRRDVYQMIGGHSREIHVADDFEIMVRSFLATRMCHIPRLGCVQYMDRGENTQRLRNPDIQRHVRYLQWKYDAAIHSRFQMLDVDDYVWSDAGYADFSRENPDPVPVASIRAEL